MYDDAVFFSSLLICISLGSYYKKIDDIEMKRNYGAGLGLLVMCSVIGHQIYHSVFMVWGNVIIIKCCDKRYVHQVSLAYTWIYILYLHLNFENSVYMIWLHQTIALRLVGLAFEVHITSKSKLKGAKGVEMKGSVTSRPSLQELETLTSNPTAVDIITYAYFFIGLHKGPYYRWKIFDDHFRSPFPVLGDCRIITEHKLKKALFFSIGYFILRMKYSPEFYKEDKFYSTYDNDFRYWYSVPQLAMFFLHEQIMMMLCTSVCTETGFGVYPAKTMPMPGYGPTAGVGLLKLASTTKDVALEQEYNFSMLKCFENEKLLLGPKMRDSLRAWEMPTRYWFWAYPYKNLIKAKKETRSACSFLIWSMWTGPSLQQVIISATLWVHLHLEEEFEYLYDTVGSLKLPWNIGFSIMRLLCLVYLTPCLIVQDASIVLRYYNSIFWIYHILLLFLTVYAVVVFKMRSHLSRSSRSVL